MASNPEPNNFSLLSIGDASLDTFIAPSESDASCNINSKDCVISFAYGNKIPVTSLDLSIGGNAANNAVGCTRLGIKTAIVLSLGDDVIGNQITDNLVKEKVDISFVKKEAGASSNSSIVIRYLGERTIFTYHAKKIYEFPQNLPKTKWIYLTSMGENFESFYQNVYNFVSANQDISLAFNPGSWQLRNIEAIKKILSITKVLFVNKEEAEKITGTAKSEANQKELLTALIKLGIEIPVITDGQNGAYTWFENKFLKLGILNLPVIERTGAGDAFGSGCLSAIIKGKTMEEALVWGMVNSSSVISFIGSQKGLLHDSEIPAWIDKVRSNNIKVEEI